MMEHMMYCSNLPLRAFRQLRNRRELHRKAPAVVTENSFCVVDVWFGALPVSRKLGSVPKTSDSMYLLELDLKAGLRDPMFHPCPSCPRRRCRSPCANKLVR